MQASITSSLTRRSPLPSWLGLLLSCITPPSSVILVSRESSDSSLLTLPNGLPTHVEECKLFIMALGHVSCTLPSSALLGYSPGSLCEEPRLLLALGPGLPHPLTSYV